MKIAPNRDPKVLKKENKLSQSEVNERIKAKFGNKILHKKARPKIVDKADIQTKGGISNSTEDDFGDIKANDPSSQLTHDKLKGILKSGAFNFNDRERSTLAKILN